jgi:hypothetical protein
MPMRDMPAGVHRVPRGEDSPPREYDIIVDGARAGWMERLAKQGLWRAYPDGLQEMPRKFGPRGGAFIAGAAWIADLARAARKTAEPVTAAEHAAVLRVPLSPVAEDPFRGDPWADPLVP